MFVLQASKDSSGNCTCFLCEDDELYIVDVATQSKCSTCNGTLYLCSYHIVLELYELYCFFVLNFFLIELLQWFNIIQLQGIEYFVWKVQKQRPVTTCRNLIHYLIHVFHSYPWSFGFLFLAGFEILAFPCNQFAGQDVSWNEEIQEVACTRLKAEFPIFDKVIFTIEQELSQERKALGNEILIYHMLLI